MKTSICLGQIALVGRIFERHGRFAKVGRLQGVPGSVRQAAPRDQGLHAADLGGLDELVVEGPV